MLPKNKRIAIVADWLIDFGGAELVISHLLETFPDADIYTSVCFMDHPMLEGRRVYTSWLQKIPFLNKRHKLAGILRPWAFRSFDLSGYDIVICSSSAESKQVAMGKWNRGKSVQNGVWGEGTVGTVMNNSSVNSKASTEGVGLPTNAFGTFGNKSTEENNGSKTEIIVYCHTPIRYYWSHYEEYRNMMEFGFFNPLARFILDNLIGWLRKIDFEAAQKVDYFIANSENTRERIKTYYKRESEVIYPGVDIEKIADSSKGGYKKNGESEGGKLSEPDDKQGKGGAKANEFLPLSEPFVSFQLGKERNDFGNKNTEEFIMKDHRDSETSSKKREDYYISIGRCIPYKKFDLLVDTFNKNGKNLVLITNTDNALFRELQRNSHSNITWKLHISQTEKNTLLSAAKGFLFPPLEDFGLVPIEAMTLGIPVIAYGRGGATETVVDGKTGIFFEEQTTPSLMEGIERFEGMYFDTDTIKNHAKQFDKSIFERKIIDFITRKIQ